MGQGLEALYGQVLENTYRITRLIGEGGMGAVYEAEHSRLPRRFAIKVLFPHVASNAVAVERFHREALITSELGHPHIVDVIDFNHTPDGLPYIVMEYLAGEDLEARMERVGPMATQTVSRILEQTASALEAVHNRDIVHRDLKPQNVFLCDQEGSNDYVKVVDFGISKIRGAGQALTRAHMVMGTPYYMSPEQAKGHADEADRRADIFAVGAMLYEMLTGRLPFQGETPDVVLYQVVHEDPPSFQELGLDIPPGVEDAIFRAIAKKPEDRWETMEELSEAFSNAVERTVIDFMPLDDIEALLKAEKEGEAEKKPPEADDERKPTDRLKAVATPGQVNGTAATEQGQPIIPGPTQQLDRSSIISEEHIPEELGTEPQVQGNRRGDAAAGTAPGLGPSSDLSARTTPSPMRVPDALAETAPRISVSTPLPTGSSAVTTEDEVSGEAKTEVMDTRALHDLNLLEQPAFDDGNDDAVDTFKEHKSAAPPGSPLDQAYQQRLGGAAQGVAGVPPLQGSTISSSMGEMQSNKSGGSKVGLFIVLALLLVGGGLTFGAVRLMGMSDGTGTRELGAARTPTEETKPAPPDTDEGGEARPHTGEDAEDKPAPVPDEATTGKDDQAKPAETEEKAADKPDRPGTEQPKPAAKPAPVKPTAPQPAAARQLSITTTPPGARVVINRKLAGWSPLAEHTIPPGKIKVVVTRSGYKRVDRTISAGERAPVITLKLEARAKKPALGTLRVATMRNGKPSGAFIFINGKRAGESPLRISLPEGNHRVEAWRRGVKSSTQRVKVTAGKTELVILKLKGK